MRAPGNELAPGARFLLPVPPWRVRVAVIRQAGGSVGNVRYVEEPAGIQRDQGRGGDLEFLLGTVPSGRGEASLPRLSTRRQATAWLGTELPNLTVCAEYAAAHDSLAQAVQIVAALADFLRDHGPWDQVRQLHDTAAATAHASGDRIGEANAIHNLGVMQRLNGNLADAVASQQKAQRLFRDLGHRQGQALALTEAAIALRLNDNYQASAASLADALELFRDLGDRQGQANAHNSLGVVQRMRGEYSTAADQHRQALALYGDLGVRLGQANALNFLSVIERLTGDYHAAISGHQRALLIAEELHDLQLQADTLNFLGEAQRLLRDHQGAAASQEQALAIYMIEPVDMQGQADALGALGRLQLDIGDEEAAAASLRHALDLYRLLGSQAGQAETLNTLGLLTSRSSAQQAEEYFTQAYDIACRIGVPLEEARALEGLGLSSSGDGTPLLLKAFEAYRRLGVPDQERVETILFH